MRMDDMVRTYVALRDKKAVAKKAYDNDTAKIDEAMKMIENAILRQFDELGGVMSQKTEYGTPYITVRETFSVADRDAYLGFVREQDAWDMLESRIKADAAREYKEQHGELPPGVKYSAIRKLNVKG